MNFNRCLLVPKMAEPSDRSVKHCLYRDCKSSSNSESPPQFFPFPKPWQDIKKTKKWIEVCGRSISALKVTQYSYICEKHFPPGGTPLSCEPFPFKSHDQSEVSLESKPNLAKRGTKTYLRPIHDLFMLPFLCRNSVTMIQRLKKV